MAWNQNVVASVLQHVGTSGFLNPDNSAAAITAFQQAMDRLQHRLTYSNDADRP